MPLRKPIVGMDLAPQPPQTRPHKEASDVVEPERRERTRRRRFGLPHALLAIVLLGSLSAAGYFYERYHSLTNTKVSTAEANALVASVGKLMFLPDGETPTIATVVDPSVLKDQPFFANAKEGDKVLVYTQNKRAILYRPGADKIVEVMPFQIPTNTQ